MDTECPQTQTLPADVTWWPLKHTFTLTANHHIAAIYPSLKGTRTCEFEVPTSVLLGHNRSPAMWLVVFHFPSPIFCVCEVKGSLEELKLPTGRALHYKLSYLCFSSDFLCVRMAVFERAVKDNGDISPKRLVKMKASASCMSEHSEPLNHFGQSYPVCGKLLSGSYKSRNLPSPGPLSLPVTATLWSETVFYY